MKKWINLYKYYIFFFICFLLIIRMIISRYNMIITNNILEIDRTLYNVIKTIITLLLCIGIVYMIYRNKQNLNRETFIKKYLRNNENVRINLIKIIKVYDEIYTNRIVDIDKYFTKNKTFRKLKKIIGEIYISRTNNRLTLESIIGSLFDYLPIFFVIVYIIVRYIYFIISYRLIAIGLILFMTRKIVKYWETCVLEERKDHKELENQYIEFIRISIKLIRNKMARFELIQRYATENNYLEIEKLLLELKDISIIDKNNHEYIMITFAQHEEKWEYITFNIDLDTRRVYRDHMLYSINSYPQFKSINIGTKLTYIKRLLKYNKNKENSRKSLYYLIYLGDMILNDSFMQTKRYETELAQMDKRHEFW